MYKHHIERICNENTTYKKIKDNFIVMIFIYKYIYVYLLLKNELNLI